MNGNIFTWTTASQIVIVFPVPGGPNTMNGEHPEDLYTIFETAFFCSTFSLI